MKEDQENKLDKFIRKMVAEAGTDQAPIDFTKGVLDKINQVDELKISTTYRPLMTRTGWILIALILIGVCTYLLTSDQEMSFGGNLIPYLDDFQEIGIFQIFDDVSFEALSNINIYNNFIYAILMLPVFIYIQIYFLQRRTT